MVRHTVKEAKRLGLEVSFNFGGPGWIIGGEWIADADKSKDMVPTFIEVKGPVLYDDLLPQKLIKTKRSWEHYSPELDGTERLLAVVAGKLENGVILQSSLTVLTNKVENNKLTWKGRTGPGVSWLSGQRKKVLVTLWTILTKTPCSVIAAFCSVCIKCRR